MINIFNFKYAAPKLRNIIILLTDQFEIILSTARTTKN